MVYLRIKPDSLNPFILLPTGSNISTYIVTPWFLSWGRWCFTFQALYITWILMYVLPYMLHKYHFKYCYSSLKRPAAFGSFIRWEGYGLWYWPWYVCCVSSSIYYGACFVGFSPFLSCSPFRGAASISIFHTLTNSPFFASDACALFTRGSYSFLLLKTLLLFPPLAHPLTEHLPRNQNYPGVLNEPIHCGRVVLLPYSHLYRRNVIPPAPPTLQLSRDVFHFALSFGFLTVYSWWRFSPLLLPM